MITYSNKTVNSITVLLDGKHVGDIERVDGGHVYVTKDRKHRGEVMRTAQAVQQSLEDD